ncbi:4693_t:CDS:1 [Ambispora leptoticha]|uniref:4693_t:CDS:1 n=1 Tax=Ambispora leptoticha TaxID=144679 RepID=A0A9N9DJI3_9GLOM|nr:4693_t:CDS:1 [Ambispora leptoticha]
MRNFNLIFVLTIIFGNFLLATISLKCKRDEETLWSSAYRNSSLIARDICAADERLCPPVNGHYGCCDIGSICPTSGPPYVCKGSSCGPNPVHCSGNTCCKEGYVCGIGVCLDPPSTGVKPTFTTPYQTTSLYPTFTSSYQYQTTSIKSSFASSYQTTSLKPTFTSSSTPIVKPTTFTSSPIPTATAKPLISTSKSTSLKLTVTPNMSKTIIIAVLVFLNLIF